MSFAKMSRAKQFQAASRGGYSTSQNREHMRAIGRKGGLKKKENLLKNLLGDSTQGESTALLMQMEVRSIRTPPAK